MRHIIILVCVCCVDTNQSPCLVSFVCQFVVSLKIGSMDKLEHPYRVIASALHKSEMGNNRWFTLSRHQLDRLEKSFMKTPINWLNLVLTGMPGPDILTVALHMTSTFDLHM